MSIASYQTLKRLQPIKDMQERTKSHGFTYGLGPAGYDIRIAETLRLDPGNFMLASAMEYFQMPNNLLGVVHDKSSWARLGLAVQNTVIEPGWCGFLTLELNNLHPPFDDAWRRSKALHIEVGTPIAQVVFHLLDEPTQLPYNGKYQHQKAGAQSAILEHGSIPPGRDPSRPEDLP
jgi:dCTP deaminase